MNPADKRLSELLDKWLTSLELHLKYSSLDDAAYRKVQPWPAHERPSRWIVEMALQKVKMLQEQLESRIGMGDAKFAEALELMGFLTNLVGSQHIRRFIPLAEPQSENAAQASQTTAPSPEQTATVVTPAAIMLAPFDTGQTTKTKRALKENTGTREMPKPKIPAAKPAAKESKSGATHRTRALAKGAIDREKQVLDDAKRLLKWGRQWHELPELISRMADRPSVADVRRLLRENKSTLNPG